MPQVSVIIPCYNCEDSIDKCLESLACQTYNDFDIIAVNDGSTDNTLQKLNNKKQTIQNLHVVDIANGGVSNARNIGIEKSSASFLTFVDSDDYVTEDYLATLISNSDKDLVVTGYISGRNQFGGGKYISGRNQFGGGKSIPSKMYSDIAAYLVDALQAGVFGFVWGKMYKRDILLRYGIKMNTQWANYEDEDFNLHYLLHCENIQTLDACNYVYLEPEYGKSYRKTDYMRQALDFLEMVKQMKSYPLYKDILNTWLIDRFLMGALQGFCLHSKEFKKHSLAIFKYELLPYMSNCRIVKDEKRKRAILLSKFLRGRPCMARIRFAFTLINKL